MCDGLVVPERAVALALEARPNIVTVHVIVADDRPHIVQFVRGRNQAHGLARVLEMREVVFLAIAPRQFVFGIFDQAVAASQHDLADRVTEARADFGERRFPAAVFSRVMQQRADRLVLIRAVFQRDRGDTEDVRDVRNAGALTPLALMDVVRVRHRGRKPLGRRQRHPRMVA